MKPGLVSIIMVCYNHARYLKQAIESVMAQVYRNWELIIVDDGSNDTSLEIAEGYARRQPDKIKVYTHQERKNLGLSISYRFGLDKCQGEFIGFLEPDDFWLPDNLEAKMSFLSAKNISLVYSDVEPIGDADVIEMRRLCLRNISSSPVNIPFMAFKNILVMNIVPTFSSIIIRKDLLNGLKFTSQRKYEMWLDWFLWIQASLKTKFLFLPERLVGWRLYRESFFNKFLLTRNNADIIIFEIGYRFMVLRELLRLDRGNFWGKFRLFAMFGAAFLKRVFIFMNNRLSYRRKKR